MSVEVYIGTYIKARRRTIPVEVDIYVCSKDSEHYNTQSRTSNNSFCGVCGSPIVTRQSTVHVEDNYLRGLDIPGILYIDDDEYIYYRDDSLHVVYWESANWNNEIKFGEFDVEEISDSLSDFENRNKVLIEHLENKNVEYSIHTGVIII